MKLREYEFCAFKCGFLFPVWGSVRVCNRAWTSLARRCSTNTGEVCVTVETTRETDTQPWPYLLINCSLVSASACGFTHSPLPALPWQNQALSIPAPYHTSTSTHTHTGRCAHGCLYTCRSPTCHPHPASPRMTMLLSFKHWSLFKKWQRGVKFGRHNTWMWLI